MRGTIFLFEKKSVERKKKKEIRMIINLRMKLLKLVTFRSHST